MDVFVKIVIGCWSFLQKSSVIGFWLGFEYDSGRWAVKNMWKLNDSNSVIYHNELVISTLCEDFKFEVIYFFTISSCITLPHDSNKRELFSSEVFYCKFVIAQAFTEFSTQILQWSSLIYNTSDTSDTSETRATPLRTSATRVLHERHECNTSATRTTRVRNERKILILITALVKI